MSQAEDTEKRKIQSSTPAHPTPKGRTNDSQDWEQLLCCSAQASCWRSLSRSLPETHASTSCLAR